MPNKKHAVKYGSESFSDGIIVSLWIIFVKDKNIIIATPIQVAIICFVSMVLVKYWLISIKGIRLLYLES